MDRFNPTRYLEDFERYYKKAKQLQEANLSGVKNPVGDLLMDQIPIYDTVNRCYAGFSNVPQQLWYGSKNPKKHQRREEFDRLANLWREQEWFYVLLVHRVTGSGASFSHDHGFRNVICPTICAARLNTIQEMVDFIKWHKQPIFTSIGNQIPPFPRPTHLYEQGGKYYLCEMAPGLVYHILTWLSKKEEPVGVKDCVDEILRWQVSKGLKRYAFVLTAWAMDLGEYFPKYVNRQSHCYYGKNAQETLNLIFSDGKKNNFDQKVDWLCERLRATKPYDMEDVLCDAIRYWENYVPKGYNHIPNERLENNSLIKDHPKNLLKTRVVK